MENDHGDHYLPAIRFPHEVTRFVVFVYVYPPLRHTVLVKETSRSSSVRAPGCAVNDNLCGRGTHLGFSYAKNFLEEVPDISTEGLF
jgi:hypothetical protein